MNSIRTSLAGPAQFLLVAGLLGTLVSCGNEPVPLAEYPEGTARGVVFEDANGNGVRDEGEPGIPGVRVSDQRMVTTTNREGLWSLPAPEKAVYFVMKPRGYMTPVTEDNIPRFYYLHNDGPPLQLEGPVIPTTGPLPESIDFPLVSQNEPDRFQAIFMGDPQPRNQMEVDFFAHDVLEELVGTEAAFAITLGDISFDRPDLYPSITQAMGMLGVPFYNTHGNHDANYDGQDNYDHFETWRTVFGPRYYAFDYGPVHFVILSNVLFPEEGDRYITGLGQDQLDWLEADLAHVPLDQLVVLSMHIPLRPAEMVPDFARLFELLKDRPHTLSFSAHSHDLTQGFLPDDWGWAGVTPHYHINAGATCGRWWEGARDETDIPHATSSDGSPNGYFLVDFDGNEYSARFKAARRPASHQMQIQAPDSVIRGEADGTPVLVNVFAASPGSSVEMRVGDSAEWVTMAFSPQPDPLYARVTERESGKRASTSYHIWEGSLPGDLAPGGHLIQVRVVDRFGQEFLGSRILRVVEESP